MSEWTSDEILDFAINGEQEAVDFYTDLAGKMEAPSMKKVFEDFAKEEMGHKAKLQKVQAGGELVLSTGTTPDLKIGDYLVEVDENLTDLDYQQALIVAMKKEKAAFRLYTNLAAVTEEPSLKALLLSLAQEEAKHKLRFEVEYDDEVLTWN